MYTTYATVIASTILPTFSVKAETLVPTLAPTLAFNSFLPTGNGFTGVTSTEICSSADSAIDCAKLLCQCAPSGYSNDISLRAGRNAVTNDESYHFEGCGAHTGYITPADDGSGVDELGRTPEGYVPYGNQIGGYPFRWCFTLGGSLCRDGSTSRKNVIQPGTSWKRCTGFYDCNADITGPIVSGTELTVYASASVLGGGKISFDDWSNCCTLCSENAACRQWSFDMDFVCRLYSDFTPPTEQNTSTQSLVTGTPGHDDPPMECLERNDYDTCVTGPACPSKDSIPSESSVAWCAAGEHRCFVEVWTAFSYYLKLSCVSQDDVSQCSACELNWTSKRSVFNMIIGLSVSGAAIIWCLVCVRCTLIDRRKWKEQYMTTVLSDEVAVTSKTSTRTRSTKHGTETYSVTQYTTSVAYAFGGRTRSHTFQQDGKPFAGCNNGEPMALVVRNEVPLANTRRGCGLRPESSCCSMFSGKKYTLRNNCTSPGDVFEPGCSKATSRQIQMLQ